MGLLHTRTVTLKARPDVQVTITLVQVGSPASRWRGYQVDARADKVLTPEPSKVAGRRPYYGQAKLLLRKSFKASEFDAAYEFWRDYEPD